MKLYFEDAEGTKRYLDYEAKTRQELVEEMGGQIFSYEGQSYNVVDVKAEGSSNSAVPAIVGGALGILGGGVGVAIGAVIGAMAGESIADTEKQEIAKFNKSTV